MICALPICLNHWCQLSRMEEWAFFPNMKREGWSSGLQKLHRGYTSFSVGQASLRLFQTWFCTSCISDLHCLVLPQGIHCWSHHGSLPVQSTWMWLHRKWFLAMFITCIHASCSIFILIYCMVNPGISQLAPYSGPINCASSEAAGVHTSPLSTFFNIVYNLTLSLVISLDNCFHLV